MQANNRIYNPKMTVQQQSLHGRAKKLLGRAGALKLKGELEGHSGKGNRLQGVTKSPESFVFEGHRASAKGHKDKSLKPRRDKKREKPKSRSSKRGAAWKAAGKRKTSK
jgi:nucleolar protein 12